MKLTRRMEELLLAWTDGAWMYSSGKWLWLPNDLILRIGWGRQLIRALAVRELIERRRFPLNAQGTHQIRWRLTPAGRRARRRLRAKACRK